MQTDCHAYIGKAIELGAVAVLNECTTDVPEGVTLVTGCETPRCYRQGGYGRDPSRKLKLVGVTV